MGQGLDEASGPMEVKDGQAFAVVIDPKSYSYNPGVHEAPKEWKEQILRSVEALDLARFPSVLHALDIPFQVIEEHRRFLHAYPHLHVGADQRKEECREGILNRWRDCEKSHAIAFVLMSVYKDYGFPLDPLEQAMALHIHSGGGQWNISAFGGGLPPEAVRGIAEQDLLVARGVITVEYF